MNLNDGQALGWSECIKDIVKNYKYDFVKVGIRDADMINFYNHHNKFIQPLAAEKKPCGPSYNFHMKKWNCNYAIPFSSLHDMYVRIPLK